MKANIRMFLSVKNDSRALAISKAILQQLPYTPIQLREQRYWKLNDLWEVEFEIQSQEDNDINFPLVVCAFFSPHVNLTLTKQHELVIVAEAIIDKSLRFQQLHSVFISFQN